MLLQKRIKKELEQILRQMGISDVPVQVQISQDPNRGDYTTNISFLASKKLGKSPFDIAGEIKNSLTENLREEIEKIEIVKPGFINFWIKPAFVVRNLQSSSNDALLKDIEEIHKGKKVVVEYSSPNIAKPFTIGHLRSTIIGDTIANLLEATGWEVYRDNHVGDWGTQFGKQIYAIKKWGNEEDIEKSDRPVKELVELYVKFHQEAEKQPELEVEAREWFKKLEDGDPEARRLWQKCIDWSWKEFNVIYKELGISFTENQGRGYGEAFFEDKMQSVIDELKKRGLLEAGDEGAKIVQFPKETKLPPLMILKKDGATLYATRDLTTDQFRLEHYGKDITIINEVGAEQTLYFRQLYRLEKILGWFKEEQRIHIKHGHYRFKDQKMSTRKGNVIWLEKVLAEAITRAQKFSANGDINLAKQVAIGAIKWNDLRRSPEQDIIFDWDDLLNMQGNSGPYLQYTYARTQSVLKKAGLEKAEFIIAYSDFQPEELQLLRKLLHFQEIVQEAAESFSPSTLCLYLFELAQDFNLFYQKMPILKQEKETEHFRLALTEAVGETLKKGLGLLGIAAPERM